MGVVLNWSSNYPSSKDTISTNYPSLSDGVHDVLASHVNSLANASVEIQKVVGGLRNAPIQDPLSLSANMLLVWNPGSSEWQAENLAASKVTVSPTGDVSSTNVQAAIAELDSDKAATSHTQAATTVTVSPAGDVSSTDVQAAIEELDSEKAANSHTQPATSVTVSPTGEVSSTDVQAAIAELDSEKAHLAGISGGQTLTGGTDASNNLQLRSTSSGTKGAVRVIDEFVAQEFSLFQKDAEVQGKSYGNEESVGFSATLTIDLSLSNKFVVGPMTADSAITLANGTAGQYFEIVLEQDGDGTDQTVTSWSAGAGVSSVQKPIGEDLTPHTGNNNVTSYIGECDGSGATVKVRLRKATDSGWETA